MRSGFPDWRRGVLVAAAGCAALITPPPGVVERWYSARFYAVVQPLLTSLSNLAPFALFDLLVSGTAIAWIVLAVRDLRRSTGVGRAAWVVALRTTVWAAALYLAFLLLWGLNYQRPRLRDTLPYDRSRINAEAAAAAARVAVDRLNALHDTAHAEGWPAAGAIDADLARSFERAIAAAGIARDVVPARPKRSIFDWYFRRAGVDGMTDPFLLETLVVGSLLPFERPFIVAHEWSHLAGIADEGEANFTGWLACVRGSAASAYSGWLFLYGELARAIDRGQQASVSSGLAPGPRADLVAIRDRYAQDVNTRVSAAGWRVYDSYLKANRVAAGAASYDEVVRLVLGLRLDGRPVIESRSE